MTKEQAIKFCESEWWKDKTPEEITALQLYEHSLCLPNFDLFQKVVERALGHPVFTHSFRNIDQLRKEFEEKYPDAKMMIADMAKIKETFCANLS